jgi:hypothetical protein
MGVSIPDELLPADLRRGDGEGEPHRERRRDLADLGKVGVGGPTNHAAEERVKLLRDQLAHRGQHRHTTVGDLGLPVALDLLDGQALRRV